MRPFCHATIFQMKPKTTETFFVKFALHPLFFPIFMALKRGTSVDAFSNQNYANFG